jgi:hypothetical protein
MNKVELNKKALEIVVLCERDTDSDPSVELAGCMTKEEIRKLRAKSYKNPWHWGMVEVLAVYTLPSGWVLTSESEYLGGCSYTSLADFKKSEYYADMEKTVTAGIQSKLDTLVDDLLSHPVNDEQELAEMLSLRAVVQTALKIAEVHAYHLAQGMECPKDRSGFYIDVLNWAKEFEKVFHEEDWEGDKDYEKVVTTFAVDKLLGNGYLVHADQA